MSVPHSSQVGRSSSPAAVVALAGALAVALLIVVAIVIAAGPNGAGKSSAAAAPANAVAASPAKQPASAAAPAPAAKIAIGLKEFAIAPTPAVGRAGHVTFRVHNTGAIKHEFVVLRTNKRAAALLKGSEASEAGNVGEIPGIAPGATKTLRLRLKPGHYAFICNLPGHYKAGQYADFVVK